MVFVTCINKTTASLTLIFLTPTGAYKMWLNEYGQTDNHIKEQISGNLYEMMVYTFIRRNDAKFKSSFLKTSRNGVNITVKRFIREEFKDSSKDEKKYVFNCIAAFYFNGNDMFDYTDIRKIKKKIESNMPDDGQLKTHKRFFREMLILSTCSFIKLPNIKHVSLSKCYKRINYIDQLFMGIRRMMANKLQHNDLHWGNVMVVQDSKTNDATLLFFDWDRSYSPLIGDNKLLSNDPTKGSCWGSQCNLWSALHSVDFYKTLAIMNTKQENMFILLKLGIKNIFIPKDTLKAFSFEKPGIHSLFAIIGSGYPNYFLTNKEGSEFFKPTKPMILLFICFGTWHELCESFDLHTGRKKNIEEQVVMARNKSTELLRTTLLKEMKNISNIRFTDYLKLLKHLLPKKKEEETFKFGDNETLALAPVNAFQPVKTRNGEMESIVNHVTSLTKYTITDLVVMRTLLLTLYGCKPIHHVYPEQMENQRIDPHLFHFMQN